MASLSLIGMGLAAQEIIPAPRVRTPLSGTFVLGPGTRIVAGPKVRDLGERLRQYLRPATGWELPVVDREAKGAIVLALDLPGAGPEGYRLDVQPDRIRVSAAEPAGLFYGLQTLRQLLPPETLREAPLARGPYALAAVRIEDGPRFAWRGCHLDTARHFMPKSFIKKHLDLMALHKLNVFHWHLTDDQGWRLEIKKYPRLTEVGAWRKATVLPWANRDDHQIVLPYDSSPHGGFYTQEDVREIVRYAADRFITVLPEIEMPGHCTAALAAYPELGNLPGRQLEVAGYWGVFPTIFNVDDHTLGFLKDVLDEVVELFPSRYIHVGGDECPKEEWSRSESVLARLKALKLVGPGTTLADLTITYDAKDEPVVNPALEKLQAWFMGEMKRHLEAKGRRLIGWDEILEGGVAPDAAIMAWNRGDVASRAARAGHEVVAADMDNTYLDRYQSKGPEPYTIGGLITLERIYGFDPVPAGLEPAAAARILGGQAEMWSEYVPTPRDVEYMVWPRLAAFSEVLWSPRENRDYAAFMKRLKVHLRRLDALDVNYRPPEGSAAYAIPSVRP